MDTTIFALLTGFVLIIGFVGCGSAGNACSFNSFSGSIIAICPFEDTGSTGAVCPFEDTGSIGAVCPFEDTGSIGAVCPFEDTGSVGAVCPFEDTGSVGAVCPFGDTGSTGAVCPFGDTGSTGASCSGEVTELTGNTGQNMNNELVDATAPVAFPQASNLPDLMETDPLEGSELYPLPTDPDGDGLYEDLNGNGEIDFVDVIMYFIYMDWISENQPVNLFDYNNNGYIDFSDVIILFQQT